MGVEEVVSTISNVPEIPSKFWNLESFTKNPELTEIHSAVVQRLQYESPDADTLELMMMERVCFLYVFMRVTEASGEDGKEIEFTRTYKEMMSLWVNMAADLRKQRLRAEETQSIRMTIVAEVSRALKEALKDVDPAVSHAVQSKMLTLVS